MILHTYKTPTYLESTIQTYWLTFKKDILASTTKEWNEEDLKGNSFSQWKTMQYHNLLQLLILIYLDVQQTGSVNTSWTYYDTKYNLTKLRNCFSCEGIDFDKALSIFSFPFIPITTSTERQIQTTFMIGGISSVSTTITKIDLKNLLDNPKKCTNSITSNCN